MKVILQENVDGVGVTGDLLDVSDGFARNYLLPRKKALLANPRNIKALEHVKRIANEKMRKEKQEFEDVAKRMSAVTLEVQAKVGKEGKLFGSVTAKDIAEGLARQGVSVDRRKIFLAHPIKELGTFAVPIKLHREVTATVSVSVVQKQETEPAPEVSV
ncbi:MAG: 50S ribosomal protein L9 [bacterium]